MSKSVTRLVAVDGCDLFLGLAVMLAAVWHFRDVCLAAVYLCRLAPARHRTSASSNEGFVLIKLAKDWGSYFKTEVTIMT
jgi:hypothetical protein